MKIIVTILLSLCLLSTVNAQTNIEISDFQILNNTNWKGTLMYKNYSDDKEVILSTTMKIRVIKNKVITEINFPKEPKANSKTKIKLRKKGTYFGNEKIISKEKLENETLKIKTVYEGKDAGKKAVIYKTYFFNKDIFIITKEVKYLDSKEIFIRNKQSYKRL